MKNTAKKFQSEAIRLEEAKSDDLELIMAWRSNPEIYRYFYIQNSPLTWDEHIKFWKSRENRIDWMILYKQNKEWRKVGSVNAKNLSGKTPEVGVFIGETTLWGKGLGKKAVSLVLDWLSEKGYKGAEARVSVENVGSQKLFEGCNFLRDKVISDGKEWLYSVKLTNKE